MPALSKTAVLREGSTAVGFQFTDRTPPERRQKCSMRQAVADIGMGGDPAPRDSARFCSA